MPTDKKPLSLEDIKPISAMSIEPTTPQDYKGFPSLNREPSDDILAKLESGFAEIMGSDVKMDFSNMFGEPDPDMAKFLFGEDVFERPRKSAAILEQNADAINLPLADTHTPDIIGLPREKTKGDVLLDRHPDAVRLPKARSERDDIFGYPM